MIISLLITLFSIVPFPNSGMANSPTSVELRRIELRDSSLYNTLKQTVYENPKCFISGMYLLDVSRSSVDYDRFFVHIGDFSPTIYFKDTARYYCIICDRTFVLSKNIPNDLFEIQDEILTVSLKEYPVYLDRDLSFSFYYVKGKQCVPISKSCW